MRKSPPCGRGSSSGQSLCFHPRKNPSRHFNALVQVALVAMFRQRLMLSASHKRSRVFIDVAPGSRRVPLCLCQCLSTCDPHVPAGEGGALCSIDLLVVTWRYSFASIAAALTEAWQHLTQMAGGCFFLGVLPYYLSKMVVEADFPLLQREMSRCLWSLYSR